MSAERFTLALKSLRPDDWGHFERLASTFLAAEFEALQTTAAPSGDAGRDAQLFSPTNEPNVVVQYSITSSWVAKIRNTAKRLKETIPGANVLIYMSNQEIGAAADDIRKELRKDFGVSLDVRDRNYFVERIDHSVPNERAAESLAKLLVDPLLASAGVGRSRVSLRLTSPETAAALTYLGLQWRDDNREKGLTKLTFGALVRAVLVGTDSDNRLSRSSIHAAVFKLLPQHPKEQVGRYVDGALRRQRKDSIRHWVKADEFCLTHSERLRLQAYQTTSLTKEAELEAAVTVIARDIMSGLKTKSPRAKAVNLAQSIRLATEAVLLNRSQAFAVAVQEGSLSELAAADFTNALQEEVSRANLPNIRNVDWVETLRLGVREVLLSDDSVIQAHLRSLADSYTLLAFLRVAPDVQGAVKKMFAHGEICLDTTIVLPLLAERLHPEPGRFTRMIHAARTAGLDLFVTPGVIEEIDSHMKRAMHCARTTEPWKGRIPYLLEQYVASGETSGNISSWLECFRGRERPRDDIEDFLVEEFGIRTRSLEEESQAAPEELRHALQTIWHRESGQRRQDRVDEMTITRLVSHDIESYCGVAILRSRERSCLSGKGA